MLRRRYQGLCPLHPDTSQLCAPPQPVHSFRSQLYDVLRQRRHLQHHPAAYRLQIPINVFILWKVDGEPSGQAVLNPRELLLRLEAQVRQAPDLRIDTGWYVRVREPSLIDKRGDRLWILAVILVGVVVIQLFRFLHMVGIHMYRLHTVILQEFSQCKPVMACRLHAGNHGGFSVLPGKLLHP